MKFIFTLLICILVWDCVAAKLYFPKPIWNSPMGNHAEKTRAVQETSIFFNERASMGTNMGQVSTTNQSSMANQVCMCNQDSITTHELENTQVSNYRYIAHGSLLSVTNNISLEECGSLCENDAECVSFNYKDASKICELLNTSPYKEHHEFGKVYLPEWKHYVYVGPRDNDTTAECPSGSFLVWYDQPIYEKHDPSLPGYTCTNHDWVAQQHANGMTDCRMAIKYDVDFRGYDAQGYVHVLASYSDSLAECLQYGCLAMICRDRDNDYRCFLKTSSHLASDTRLTAFDTLLYWYTVCT